MTKISIAIPIYEYSGKGNNVLEYSFRKFEIQTFKDFEIVVSDHSIDDNIENLCSQWINKLNIKYYRNEIDRGSGASNTNNVIKLCASGIIKILCADDYLLDENSLQQTVDAFDSETKWVASAYLHTTDRENYFRLHIPSINPQIFVVNTIGSPSGVSIRKLDNIPLMDKNLQYCYDEEWYFQMIKLFGEPKILAEPTVANYLWDNALTKRIDQDLINRENNYILNKHNIQVNNVFNSVSKLS